LAFSEAWSFLERTCLAPCAYTFGSALTITDCSASEQRRVTCGRRRTRRFCCVHIFGR
jgi:hypothetical protein